jgi:hypothetical protein
LTLFPEPFHEYVIPTAVCDVHADLDSVVFQQAGKIQVGELAALVGVEDVRFPGAVDCGLLPVSKTPS